MRILTVTLALLALAGCGAQQKTADTSATAAQPAVAPTPTAETGTPAVVAAAPREITELTNQKLVYECPKCGMDFDAAGKCSMDGTELVSTQVDYICPKDGKSVEMAGKCPRCAMNARVEKTAMTGGAAPGKN